MSIAASAAASVVWLTPEPAAAAAGLPLSLAAPFSGLATTFLSDFLIVTGTFDCAKACWLAALDADFTRDADTGLETDPAVVVSLFFMAVPNAPRTALLPVPAPAPLAAAVFGLGAAAAGAMPAGLAFFAEDVRVFADFFIALTMESTSNDQVFR